MRSKLRAFLIALGVLLNSASAGQEVRILVQSSALAGFNYHHAALLWDDMRVGDRLQLVREPENPHDGKAIRVDWQGQKLGYVPRKQNEALAWAMDQGQPVAARISRMELSADPWRRIEFEVYVE